MKQDGTISVILGLLPPTPQICLDHVWLCQNEDPRSSTWLWQLEILSLWDHLTEYIDFLIIAPASDSDWGGVTSPSGFIRNRYWCSTRPEELRGLFVNTHESTPEIPRRRSHLVTKSLYSTGGVKSQWKFWTLLLQITHFQSTAWRELEERNCFVLVSAYQ